jgi:cation transport ATPase
MSGACKYNPPKHESTIADKPEDKRVEVLRLIAMATITISIAWLHLLPSPILSNSTILLAVIIGGYPIFKESFLALKKGRVNMELSMVIAIIASIFLLQFLPAIVITFFALLSEFIEEFIVEKGRRNIELLYNKAPKKAIVKRNQNDNTDPHLTKTTISTEEISVEKVKIEDIVIIREGDAIPIDGQIINGSSTIDQSTITGESMPVEKSVGDYVFAGTINLSSKLEVICKRVSTDTTYAKIIHLVEESESSKAPIQKLSDKMATRLIQFAIGLSVMTFIATQNLVSTLSVIVVAGACGLAVGTPIALLASNSKLAKNGIIVKGGLQIENIQKAGTIVFDKTGTLTVGRPTVKQIISFNKSIEKNKVLEYAAIAERDVNHPLAKAIVEKASKEQISFKEKSYLSYNNDKLLDNNNNNKPSVKVGRGVSLLHNDHRIIVGNIHFLKEQFQHLFGKEIGQLNSEFFQLSNDLLNKHLDALEDNSFLPSSNNTSNNSNVANTNANFGDTVSDTLQIFRYNKKSDEYKYLFDSTTVFVALDKEIIGGIILEDEIRFGAKDVISAIKSMKLHPVMLTGDNKNIAKKIAQEIGIDEYYADLLPEVKVTKIKEIVGREQQKRKGKERKRRNAVIMVGDGINDAPALAEADIGIAMGKTGTDIVIETADVVLMNDDLTKIPHLIKSSRNTIFTIRQNFFGTLAVDGLGFILAFAGILHPLLAAFIHVISELFFMVNSARLLRGDT